jgi:aspartate racemase
MLLATQGTYRIGLYDEALAACGITVHLPQEAERELLMQGIYQGVKADKLDMARTCFSQVAHAMRLRHGDVPLIMGCTEIPLALPGAPDVEGLLLVDPAQELAHALARVAYGQ